MIKVVISKQLISLCHMIGSFLLTEAEKPEFTRKPYC